MSLTTVAAAGEGALSPLTPATSAKTPQAGAQANAEDPALREAARQFEQVFIAQMLKQAKLGETSGSFTGGYGEDAFRSFMVDEYAEALTQSQSFGLADKIYAQLKEKADAHVE